MSRANDRRVTIKEVAREAGVSAQTVSRVINDRPDVAPETRDRVRTVIKRLGYQPSALARSLIQQRSYSNGIIWAVAEMGNNRECFHDLPLPLATPMIFLTAEARPGWHIVSVDNLLGGRMAPEHLLH